jgi:pyrimidine deaminase RibD-like protein
VIVKDGEVIAESANKVAQTHDPTAQAEILAIREACMKLGTEHLAGATTYVMAHPCPMCLGSLYYCSPKEVIEVVLLVGLALADALRTPRRRGGCLPVLAGAQRGPA